MKEERTRVAQRGYPDTRRSEADEGDVQQVLVGHLEVERCNCRQRPTQAMAGQNKLDKRASTTTSLCQRETPTVTV